MDMESKDWQMRGRPAGVTVTSSPVFPRPTPPSTVPPRLARTSMAQHVVLPATAMRASHYLLPCSGSTHHLSVWLNRVKTRVDVGAL
ncbi:hypothetical protein E2C01_068176 [Portunus trituberculatus]|uniref:Uncharacterized protein n=1 Tax=Portunus trituberculatus TaxID=210409 RepID=A0A5B7HVU4_PORTR|nr:hypothetical protein [Portunus trituberculatus]